MEQIQNEFLMDGIRDRINDFTLARIADRNEALAAWYRRSVADWDLNHPAGVSRGRPLAPLLLIPAMRDDGYLWLVEDPTGALVCEEVPLPTAPPPLPAGVEHVGAGFGDSRGWRICHYDDTMPEGHVAEVDGIKYKKTFFPFWSGLMKYYVPVVK